MSLQDLDRYDFDLPPELIADRPAVERAQSRLLVVHGKSGRLEHRQFGEITSLLHSKDLLVRNNTRVRPARLTLQRASGRSLDAVFLRSHGLQWQVLMRRGRIKEGEVLTGHQLPCRFRVHFTQQAILLTPLNEDDQPVELDFAFFERYGQMPIPPYMERSPDEADRERYQTVYAAGGFSVAAPTAGLHFTPALLNSLEAKGVQMVDVSLEIGYGTFAPLKESNFTEGRLHAEEVVISEQAAQILAGCALDELICVGTTSLRALESCLERNGRFVHDRYETDLFIYPPRKTKIRRLLTNFHLPRSSLFMLVCSLASTDLLHRAYREAISEGYRFYSYGDAMLVLDDE